MSLWFERQIAKGDVDYDPEYDAAYRIDPDPLRPTDDTVALEDDVNDDEPWEPAEQPERAAVVREDDPLSCGECYDIAHDELDERETCDEHAAEQPEGS